MLTFLPLEQIDEMDSWQGSQLNTAKEILAYELTKLVHGEAEAEKAQETARAVFAGVGSHENMPTVALAADDFTDGKIGLLSVMVKGGMAASNGEARRLVTQGGVTVNDEKATNPSQSFTSDDFKDGIIVKKGKKVIIKFVTE